MTGTHLHLLVNHVPILGAILATLLLAVSFFYAADVMRRTALVLLLVVAGAGAAAKWSGEPAEDGVRGMPGVTRDAIHEHEELADTAFIAAGVLGLAALVVLYRARQAPVPRGAAMGVLVGAVVVSGLMAQVGLLGGQIRHTEVRPGATKEDALFVEPPRVRGGAPPGDVRPDSGR
jgi:hypothetical protein